MLAVQVDWKLFNDYKDAMSPLTLLVVMIVISVSGWLVFHLRARFREDSGRADGELEMLTQFRELHQQGELSEDEYRLIKSRLVREAASRLNVISTDTPDSAIAAVRGVRQDGGIEKAGEAGRDDKDVRESRSTDEPPNQKSANEK